MVAHQLVPLKSEGGTGTFCQYWFIIQSEGFEIFFQKHALCCSPGVMKLQACRHRFRI